MMKLSIIVPVYCVEATLERCVKSILIQSFADYELLLIDDGSPDRCPQICDELAAHDNRIKVIHQSNEGLSAARNAGLRVAKGDYIAFVDSDDMLSVDTLQPLMEELERHPEYDILEFSVQRFIGSPKESMLLFDNCVYTDRWDYWLRAEAYAHAYAWNKIYRRELFTSVMFPAGKVFEDVYTLPLLLQKAKIVATTDKGLYLYYYNAHGITSTADGYKLKELLTAHLSVLADTSWQHLRNRPLFRAYYAHVLNIQIDVFGLLGEKPELSFIPTGFPGRNIKLWMLRLMGVRATCQCFKYIHQLLR